MGYVLGENNTYVRQKYTSRDELMGKVVELRKEKTKLRAEINQLKKQHEKEIAELNRLHAIAIAKKENAIEKKEQQKKSTVQTTAKTRNYLEVTKFRNRALKKKIAELQAKIQKPPKTTKQLHLEIIYRTIIAYNKLNNDGILAFEEFALLLIGSQKDFFSQEDVISRFPGMKFVKRNILLCMEAGYIDKLYRKKLYFLTMNGKIRLNDIMEYIYKEKGTGYAIQR